MFFSLVMRTLRTYSLNFQNIQESSVKYSYHAVYYTPSTHIYILYWRNLQTMCVTPDPLRRKSQDGIGFARD